MIRVGILAHEKIPDSLKAILGESGEIQWTGDASSPDVFLFYTETWSRPSLVRAKEQLGRSLTPIVVLCERTHEPFATDSFLQEQVAAVLPVHSKREQIVLAFQAAAAGLKILHPSLNGKAVHFDPSPLTPRELEILGLIADGEGNKSIAYLLEISEHTVKFHVSSVFEKLHVSSRTEAVKAGITRGLISI